MGEHAQPAGYRAVRLIPSPSFPHAVPDVPFPFPPNFDLITYRMMYRCSGEGEREFIERAQQVPRGWAVRDIQKWVTTENLASSLLEKTFMKFDFECPQAQPQVETREGSMSLLRHAHIPNALAYADARHSAPSFTHHADIQWNKYDVSNFLHFLQYNHIMFRLSFCFLLADYCRRRHTKFHRKSDRYNTWEGDQSWKKFQVPYSTPQQQHRFFLSLSLPPFPSLALSP
jgi:hypothetical protein